MNDDALVPMKLRVLFAILRATPMTELKTAVGLVLLCGTAVFLAVAACFRIALDVSALDSWLLFLSGLLAIASFGQGWKQSVYAKTQAAAAALPSSPVKAGAP